jgi:uncharacterized SAM-binding protein YcdF (DUF218 family)
MKSIDDTTRIPGKPSSAGNPYSSWPTVLDGAPAPKAKRKWRRPLRSEIKRWALVLAIFLPAAVFLLLASMFIAIYWQSRIDQTRPVDAIVVLGAAQYDGRPSPVLQARLDQVLDAWEKGVAPLIVVSGGKLEGDRFTEAEASRNYLVDHGVPSDRILLENEGHSSWESMEGIAAILDEQGAKRILLVSDGFHILRLKLMARHFGFTAYGDPATDSPIRQGSSKEFDYMIREGGGILDFYWEHVL